MPEPKRATPSIGNRALRRSIRYRSKACRAAFTASICLVTASFSDRKVSMRDSCSSMPSWRCVNSWSAVFRCSSTLVFGADAGALPLGPVVVGGAVATDDLSGWRYWMCCANRCGAVKVLPHCGHVGSFVFGCSWVPIFAAATGTVARAFLRWGLVCLPCPSSAGLSAWRKWMCVDNELGRANAWSQCGHWSIFWRFWATPGAAGSAADPCVSAKCRPNHRAGTRAPQCGQRFCPLVSRCLEPAFFFAIGISIHYSAVERHEVTILYRNTALDLHQLPSRELVKMD